jgi:hypothetical protein
MQRAHRRVDARAHLALAAHAARAARGDRLRHLLGAPLASRARRATSNRRCSLPRLPEGPSPRHHATRLAATRLHASRLHASRLHFTPPVLPPPAVTPPVFTQPCSRLTARSATPPHVPRRPAAPPLRHNVPLPLQLLVRRPLTSPSRVCSRRWSARSIASSTWARVTTSSRYVPPRTIPGPTLPSHHPVLPTMAGVAEGGLSRHQGGACNRDA